MVHEITLRIRYKPRTKIYEYNLLVEEERLSCDALAWKLSEITTMKYMDYLGGTKDKRLERRYRLGQYKMIRNILEAKI